MICPRCGMEIHDTETICPFCLQEIDTNIEFNNFQEDGFIQLRTKKGVDVDDQGNYVPKYFNITEINIFVVAIVFILAIAAVTVFGVKFIQTSVEKSIEEETVTEYIPETVTETTVPATKNTVKNLSIKDIYGSWKFAAAQESTDAAIAYFSFFKNGTVQENYGSIVVEGSFQDFSENDENIVYIKTSSTLNGVYNFDVKGNEDDGYELTLIDTSSGGSYVFSSAEAKSYTLDKIPDYKIDEDLIGRWVSDNKSYEFSKGGSITRIVDSTTTYGVWTVNEKNILTIKYMQDVVKTIELNYKFNKEKLIINNVAYTKENND